MVASVKVNSGEHDLPRWRSIAWLDDGDAAADEEGAEAHDGQRCSRTAICRRSAITGPAQPLRSVERR
jgi:hypothetical protein